MPEALASPDPVPVRLPESPLPGGEHLLFLTQAATELGKRGAEGVPLCSLPIHSWWIENQQLHVPYPGSGTRIPCPPDREDLESALHNLSDHPLIQSCSALQRFRFLTRLTAPLPLPASEIAHWKRIHLHQHRQHIRDSLRHHYHVLLNAKASFTTEGARGSWRGAQPLSLEDLIAGVTHSYQHPVELLKKGRRASLWLGELQEQPVIIKRYEPNPRPWRRPLEICRARRAWAGANLLVAAGINVPEPLAWFELTSGPDRGTSVFITRSTPHSETVRSWLRREAPALGAEQRVIFRHRLRRHLMQLYSKGLVHLDCKLSNLRLCTDPESQTQTFLWTDLEDIRPQRWQTRTFLRNLYQLNGSLPRSISREERIQFVKGFRSLFACAGSPWVIRYVERVTRKRHLRELRRQCGA